MFCTKCGKEFREGASFCTGCGAPRPKLEGPAPQPDQPPVPPVQAPIPQPEPAIIPPAALAPDIPETIAEAPAAEPQEPAEPAAEIPFESNESDPAPEVQPEPVTPEPPVWQAPAPVIQPAAPAVQAAPPAEPPFQPPIDLEPSTPKKKKGAGGIIAIVIILILLAAAAACFFLGRAGVPPFALLFSLGEGGDAPYQDTVKLADLIARPDSFDGQRIGVNAEVSGKDDSLLTALVTDGKDELEIELSFAPDKITAFSRGDDIYIDGTFHAGEPNRFDPAIVTFTGGRDEGTSLRTAAVSSDSPAAGDEGEGDAASNENHPDSWTSVSDYTPYQGYFTAAATEQEFKSYGGPVVVLSSERSSLLYAIYSYDVDGTPAMISGAAPMDGSTEISFYGDDANGNTVSGTLYLLEDGSVAVESDVVDAGSLGWALKMGYTPLTPCAFSEYFTTPQPPEHQQELRVTTNGPYATVTLYNWNNGDWVETMSFQATIGLNGTSAAKQEGDRCTPAGTYDILFAFSSLDIFSGIPFHRVEEGDVWVTDTGSAYYNTLQSTYSQDKDWSSAEDLYDKFTTGRSTACIYFGFNGDGLSAYSAVAGGGSDLFLDGVGANGDLTTGYGDIKTDGQNVLDLLRELNGNKNPVIIID